MDESRRLPELPSRSTILWIVGGFFALCFIVYGASLSNRFVAWDDNYVINFNPVVRGFSVDHLVKTFTTFVDPELYNPLTFISYQLDYTIGGLKPFIFHFTNLLLHTLNAILVAWFLYVLSKRGWLSIVAAILFAVHPLNVEAVAWASARKDVLSTFFFFATLISYLYYKEQTHRSKLMYAISLAAFLLGLLSKVMVLTIPVILLMIDYLQHRKWSTKPIIEKIPYFALSGIFGIIAIIGKQAAANQATILETILMGAKSTVFYLEKFFVPIRLAVIYPYTKQITISSPDFFIPVLLVVLLIALAVFSYVKKWRFATFGLCFYLLTLVPTFLNFAKGGEFYFASDRYAYVPQIGLLLIIIVLLHAFFESQSRKKNIIRTASSLIALIIGLLAVLSYKQSLVWKNSETLFVQTLKYYPDAVAASINLGLVYRESGFPEKAMPLFQDALKIRPNNALLIANIGATLDKQGKTEEAIKQYEKAIAMEPKQPDSYYALGMVYERQGKIDEAFALYEKVREMNPQYVGVYNNLGSVYVQKNDLEKAREMYEKAISIDPYYSDAHFNLAYVSEKLGDSATAAKEYETTLELEGEKIEILQTLTGIYAQQNMSEETVRTVKRMLAVDPTNDFATKLYNALKQSGLLQ